jgi:hypothetical protein
MRRQGSAECAGGEGVQAAQGGRALDLHPLPPQPHVCVRRRASRAYQGDAQRHRPACHGRQAVRPPHAPAAPPGTAAPQLGALTMAVPQAGNALRARPAPAARQWPGAADACPLLPQVWPERCAGVVGPGPHMPPPPAVVGPAGRLISATAAPPRTSTLRSRPPRRAPRRSHDRARTPLWGSMRRHAGSVWLLAAARQGQQPMWGVTRAEARGWGPSGGSALDGVTHQGWGHDHGCRGKRGSVGRRLGPEMLACREQWSSSSPCITAGLSRGLATCRAQG